MIKRWIAENKEEKWFKYVVIIAILIIIALAANQYSKYKHKLNAAVSTETTQETAGADDEEQEETDDSLVNFLKNNKLHLIGITGVAVGLAVIEHKKKHSIKESR